MTFRALHINAQESDLAGNDGRGRFFLLPGSRTRAARIAEAFAEHQVKEHPRGHDLHIGVIERGGKRVDVGVISTGMGCPSVDLIVTELIRLGAGALLRIGTSGSLQHHIHTGDLVVATAAVRDEGTSDTYLPKEFPALASWPMLCAIQRAVDTRTSRGAVHFGPVHTKDSLYAREFRFGPKAAEHEQYEKWLTQAGVCATEMECAHLFVLAQLGRTGDGQRPALAGGLMAVLGELDEPFADSPKGPQAVEDAIELGLETFLQL